MTAQNSSHPRIGVPYRSTTEERAGKREAYEKYLRAVAAAGAEAIEISLGLNSAELNETLRTLDGVVLPGSPADVDPARYHAKRSPHCAGPDPAREQTDFALLDHALENHKPVLAICYGIQSLNVYLRGSLIQDIATEVPNARQHEWKAPRKQNDEPFHTVQFDAGSRLARLAGASEAKVNSSHHQAIREPAGGLRVVAHAPDGVIEAVEWTRDANWVTAVQWHPERMPGEALARALFQEFVNAAVGARVEGPQKSAPSEAFAKRTHLR